jgi:NAD(P)-dependent dehydrogenase (short-subunit alcohol dehydrogenase family)
MMELALESKVAFITGATRGIGRAIAERLGEEGCAIGLCARDGDAVRDAINRLESRGVRAHGVVADVTDEPTLTAAVGEVAGALGGLDLVVANAGGAAGGARLQETTAADWERTLSLNITHPAMLLRAALPHLRARGGGAAVVIASISGMRPQPLAQYAAAKAAEIHLAHTLARELGPEGVRVNAVSPGSILFEGAWERWRRWPTWRPSCSPSGRAGSAARTWSSTAPRTSRAWAGSDRRPLDVVLQSFV